MNESLKPTLDLAPDYYLHNFRFMLDWVWQSYADLLSEHEHKFIHAFNQLDHDAQCLLVRLSSRKGPLFRQDKLAYPEINSIEMSAQKLVAADLLSTIIPLDLNTLANALTKLELLQLFGKELTGLKQARKETLIQTLAPAHAEFQTWEAWTNNQLGRAWYLDNQSIINTLLLLFFGNAYQNLTEFVLQDLGLFRYEKYTIDSHHRLFKSREELDQYQHLVQLRAELEVDSSIPTLLKIAAQLPPQCTTERLQRRRAKLCNQIAYALERADEHSSAMQLYEQSHLPPARERRIRLLEKQERYSDAWQLLSALLSNPLDEQELHVAQRMAPRLAKKSGLTFKKQLPVLINTQQIQLQQITDTHGNTLRVEEIVRQSLDAPNAPCVYAENLLLNGLFGLWLWPEMFRDIEGAFANPFQAAPLDMYQENFVTNRPHIQQLWESLDKDEYHHSIQNTWREKQGIANHLVNWNFLSSNLLDMALHTIPAKHLKLFFERMLFDIKNNRSGLPDLIQFFPEEKTYRLIEVKGPGDRIQDNQQRWLEYFSKHHIPAEVYYVSWQ